MSAPTVDVAVRILNEIHAADPTVLPALIDYRVPCNDILADHPTVQVGGLPGCRGGFVGLLGILNGLFGAGPRGGFIGAVYDDDHQLTHFRNLGES